jgi:hypothetical protein
MKKMSTQKGYSAATLVLTAAALFLIGSLALAANTYLKQKDRSKIADLGTLSNIETGLPDSADLPTAGDFEVLSESDFLRTEESDGAERAGAPLTEGELFALAPDAILEDRMGSGAIGKAALAVYEGTTYLRVAAIGLPAPTAGSAYYAWLSRDESKGEFIVAGAMDYDPAASQARLSYAHPGDISGYRRVIVTAGPPGSGVETNRVLEGAISDDALPYVTRDDINRSRAASGVAPLPEAPAPGPAAPPMDAKKATTTSMTAAGLADDAGNELLLRLLAGKDGLSGDSAGTGISLQDLLAQSGLAGSASDQELLQKLLGN